MNPYDFVRVDWNHPPTRAPYDRQDRFQGVTGSIDCRLVSETPIFIPQARETASRLALSGPQPFVTNGAGTRIIPGSSLKGLLRGLVETLAPGCWSIFDGSYKNEQHPDTIVNLPAGFRRCDSLDLLCPACRMFGCVVRSGNGSLAGKVSIGDAVCEHAVPHAAVFTPILGGPKPRHTAWYKSDNGRPAGRKYYFHHSQIQTAPAQRTTKNGTALNQHIEPLGTASVFTVRVAFANLSRDEMALLLFCLTLEPSMRHKIGFAKPAGYGSVHITADTIQYQDMAARYRGEPIKRLSGATAEEYVVQQAAEARGSISLDTLSDLHRIWRWPPVGLYSYPSRDWFSQHPTDPISKTP